MDSILWAIVWFLALIFVAWPVGFLLAWVYILIAPLTVCCGCDDLRDALLKWMNIPITCAQYMMDGKAP